MIEQEHTIMLAAGGTGGHIFPAESLAAELVARGHEVILITDKRYKKRQDSPEQLQVKVIPAASPGGGVVKKLVALFQIAAGVLRARGLMKKYKPACVVGFGGYPSFPSLLAAKSLKVAMIVHEQNSVLGRVNKVVAPWCRVIATSFHKVVGIREADEGKIVFTGNPVRRAILAIRDMPYPELGADEHLQILVTGGSQGASIFSQLVPDAIASLPEQLRARVRIDQQCRAEDLERVKKVYLEANVNADLATFFEDIPSRLAAAHVVIARSGASTVAELCVAGRPAILIPYLYAMDDHQTVNAKLLKEADAAFLLHQKEAQAEDIAAKIKDCLLNAEHLEQMASNAHSQGVHDATGRLTDAVLGVIAKTNKKE